MKFIKFNVLAGSILMLLALEANAQIISGIQAINGPNSRNAEVLIDGVTGASKTQWESVNVWNSNGYPMSAVLNLGKVYQVSEIDVFHGNGGSGNGVIKMEYLPAGQNLSENSNFNLIENHRDSVWNNYAAVKPASPVQTQYLQLTIHSISEYYQLSEIRVSGAAKGSIPESSIPNPRVIASVPTPSPSPFTQATPASVPVTGVSIVVSPNLILHRATSHVLGVNRNHIAGQSWSFPNAAAKMQAMLQLTPTWGEKKMLYRIGHGPIDGRLDMGPGYEGFHFMDHFGSNSSYPFDQAGYPYDDVRNGLAEAALMNADQIHVVNFGTSDPGEAGRYVSYLNRSNDSVRRANPIAQQNVQLFELGNEISWDQVRGHAEFAPDELTYAKRANLFSQSMRANSDVPIKIGAVLSANLSLTGNGWSEPAAVTRNLLNTMGTNVDFLTYHGYAGWPMAIDPGSQPAGMPLEDALTTYFAQVEYHRGLLTRDVLPAIKAYNAATGRDVFLANTEFLSSYADAPKARGMWGALFSADETVEAMNYDIRTSVNFCLSHGELADSLMFLNDDPTQVTAVFRFLRMLAHHWGDQVIDTHGQSIPVKVMSNNGFTVNLAALQFSASLSADQSKVYVMVANVLNDDVQSSIALPFTPSSVTAYELSGSDGISSTSNQVQEKTTSSVSLANHLFKKASITIFEIVK